ncbi:MAG: phospholipase D family protein [Methylophilaceae bacterium]|nr:phospholipase D family protein [Methylophilaceae bacterium]
MMSVWRRRFGLKNLSWLLMGGVAVLPAMAQVAAEVEPAIVLNARVEAAFTPGEDIAGKIIASIGQARRQILVQAFSFTHDGIARALIEAYQRGVEVRVIADQKQTEQLEHGQVPKLARAGIPVWLDGEHQSAHSKVMVIDAGLPTARVITGSFNFTRAAQYKNAENVVFIDGSATLVQDYVRNWQRHLKHAHPLVLH